MRIWKLLWAVTEAAIGGKKRQRNRIVDGGLNAVRIQVRRQRIAARVLDRI